MKKIILISLSLITLIISALFYLFAWAGEQNTLARINNPGETTTTSQSSVIQAIKFGGEWFINNQNEDFINYEYYIYKNEYSKENHSLREMGALWSITQLAKFLKDERYEQLAQKGFKYFEQSFKEDKDNNFIYINITPKKIKLGYSAFAILSLLEIEHPKKDIYLEKLANGILSLQQENGSIRTFFYITSTTGIDYYPGEALVALMSLYEYTNNENYLNAVKKAFPYYENYFNKTPNTAFVPWQTRAYYKYYKQTKDQEVANFIFKMNDYMVKENLPQNECSNFKFPRGLTTTVFMEGINKAYNLASDLNDEKRKTCYANFIKEASEYAIDLQIQENEIKPNHLKPQALGGFLNTYDSESQRVDRNQHSVMALMEAYESGIIQ